MQGMPRGRGRHHDEEVNSPPEQNGRVGLGFPGLNDFHLQMPAPAPRFGSAEGRELAAALCCKYRTRSAGESTAPGSVGPVGAFCRRNGNGASALALGNCGVHRG